MIGIIDIGGGTRGAFGTGVYDRLIDENIDFPYIIGVSAGAANSVSYISRQRGRNLPFYTEYTLRPEYMGFKNLIDKGSYLDLSYIYGVLSNEDGERPLDFEKMSEYGGRFITVATNAANGKPVYFEKDAYKKNNYTVLMASSCLPAVCKPVPFQGIQCFDGGVSDPIPIRKAFYDGCDKVVLIITRPKNEMHSSDLDKKAAFIVKNKYPAVAQALRCRDQVYNTSLEIALEYEKQGKVLIIAPDSCEGLSTLTRDKEKLTALYDSGYNKAGEILSFIK